MLSDLLYILLLPVRLRLFAIGVWLVKVSRVDNLPFELAATVKELERMKRERRGGAR